MPAIDKSNNIENVKFIIQDFNLDNTPATGWAQLGIDATGIYYADENAVIHRADSGGGGATQLDELTDVSSAVQTSGFVLASTGGDYEGRALLASDIPQLAATKFAFSGVRATHSSIVIDTEFVDVDVDGLVSDYDTDSYFVGDGETFTIPTGFSGYYEIIPDLQTIIDSASIPLRFNIDMYVNASPYERWTMDNACLLPLRVSWAIIAEFLQGDDITFKVSKEGGTALANDELTVIITIAYRGTG